MEMLQKKASVVLKNNPVPSFIVVFCSLAVFNILLLKVWEERWLILSLT